MECPVFRYRYVFTINFLIDLIFLMLILLHDSFSRLKGEALAKCVLRVYPVHELAKGQERERYTDLYSTCFLLWNFYSRS